MKCARDVLRLLLFFFVVTLPSHAQTSGLGEEKEAALFLERILRPWSQVIPRWDRDPTTKEWQSARVICGQAAPERVNVQPKGNATASLPPRSERFGHIAFYRGDKGLQMVDWRNGAILMFPNFNAGRAANGAPVYKLHGDGHDIVAALGQTQTDSGEAVVMVFDGGLYLSCRQPESDR